MFHMSQPRGRRRRDPFRGQILGAYRPPTDPAEPTTPTDPATADSDPHDGRTVPPAVFSHREEPPS